MTASFQRVEADLAISVTELKKDPNAVFNAAQSQAVAVLNHNRVVGYVISPVAYEGFLEMAEDLEDIETIEKRAGEKPIRVNLDDL